MNKTALTILAAGTFTVVALWLLSDFAVYLTHQRTALLSKPPAHGTSFVIHPDLSRVHDSTNVAAALKAIIRRRFDKNGSAIFLQTLPDSRIHVVVPVTDPKAVTAAQSLVAAGGHLEFHLVAPDSDQIVKEGKIPPGYQLLQQPATSPSGNASREFIAVQEAPAAGLTGNIVDKANVVLDAAGNPNVDFQLNHKSAMIFAELTRTNIGNRLAMILDGRLNSAPVIRSEIQSGRAEISGSFDAHEALMLSILIECPLPVPVTLEETKTF